MEQSLEKLLQELELYISENWLRPAEEQQEMPESRYDTPEYQEFLKQQEGSSGPETPEGPAPEEESPELEISRSGEAAPEEECPGTAEETPEKDEEPKADRSKLQY